MQQYELAIYLAIKCACCYYQALLDNWAIVMTEIALFEAKNRLSELIDRVQSGEVFVITRRGKVVARLTNSLDPDQSAQAKIAISRLQKSRSGVTLGKLSPRDLITNGRR